MFISPLSVNASSDNYALDEYFMNQPITPWRSTRVIRGHFTDHAG